MSSALRTKNREDGSAHAMFSLNEAINSLALIEIPLGGRMFTLSNMQSAPLLEKLDWVFSSKS